MSPSAAVELQCPMTSSSLQSPPFSFTSEMAGDRPVNTNGSRRSRPRLAKLRKQPRRDSGAESNPFRSEAAAPVNTGSSCNASFYNRVSDDVTPLSNDFSFAFTCKNTVRKENMNFNDECETKKRESGSVDEEKAKKSGSFKFEFQSACKVNSGVFGTSWHKESGSGAINGKTVVDEEEKIKVETERVRYNYNRSIFAFGQKCSSDNEGFDVKNEDSKSGFGNIATSSTTDPAFKLPAEMEKLNINECGGGGDKKKDPSVNLKANDGASFVFSSSAKPSSSANGSSERVQEQKTDSGAASVERVFVDSFVIDNNDRIRDSASCGNLNSKLFTFQAVVDERINSDTQTNVAASFESQPSDNGASMVGGQRKDESCPSTPVGSGVSFTEFITPIWDPSSFKANLYSEPNKKNMQFNVKSRSKKDKRPKRTRGNFRQSSLCKQQWPEQNPKSPECCSPMDFSPYLDTPVADHPSRETCVTSNDSLHPDNNGAVNTSHSTDGKVENLATTEVPDTSIGDQKSREPIEESLHPDGKCPLKSYIFGTATAYSSCREEEVCDNNVGATMASASDGEVFDGVSHESVQHCFAQDRKYFAFSASSSTEGNLPCRKTQLRKKSKKKGGKVGSSSVLLPPHASSLLSNTVHGQEKDKCSSESILRNKSEVAEQVVKGPVSSSAAFEEACKTWRFRGNQAYKSGHMSEAEDSYTQGINSVPLKGTEGCCIKPLVLCYSNRAAARISLGRIREALEDCLMAAAMDPYFLKVYVRAANCHLMLGEIENAMQYYNKLLESGPNICLDRRITIEASDGLQKAQKVAECTNHSAALLEQKTLEAASEALEIITEGLSTSSCSEKLLEMKAEALCLLRKYEETIQLCEQTLCIAEKNFSSVGPDNCSMNMNASGSVNYPLARLWRWCLMSKSYFCMGKLEAALDLLQKLEQVGPISNKQGKEILESSISLAATIRELLHCKNAGNEAFRSGKYTEAVDYYTVALSSNVESRPFAAICFCNRAAAHQALGHIADAIADCSLSMALDRNYSKAVSRRSVLHEMIRDYAQAASDLQRLVSVLQNRSDEKAKQHGSPGRSTGSKELKQACRRMSLMEEEAKRGVPLDFYLILGVKASDTASDIKKAYRKAALRHHPDKACQFLAKTESGDEGRLWKEIADEVHKDADRLFKMIGEAYAILSDPTKVSPSSLYLVPTSTSPMPSVQASPGRDQVVSTPWSGKRAAHAKEIMTEEQLEQFLAEIDEKITESAGKLATPPPTVSSFGLASPTTVTSSANASGTTRSTPLRPVRMSPGSQKFTTPPKKGEGDLPPPMSMEESIEAFEQLGIYPQIEQWRDRLRQWFSSVLLNPLLNKIETSHIQVMNAASKLGISITVNPVGSDLRTSGSPVSVSPIDRTKEWQPAFTLDEDSLLHQLRASLVQSLDTSMHTAKFPLANPQQSQQNPMILVMQECVDAITEHQRLHALVKGEWVKGLLPQSSIRADYTVQRVRELAEGTCLKNYEYLGNGEVYDKKNKNWTLELPTDSHLLLYLFCAFLEHPKWMLHVDPSSYAGAQSSKNPLFLGVLPPKERFPEKYIAVISGYPSTLHPGASVLVVGRQSPPVFALYWDKKSQFSLQGRTALWDSILLVCHRIKVGYGGIVRGMHLGSSALNILPVLDSENDDS